MMQLSGEWARPVLCGFISPFSFTGLGPLQAAWVLTFAAPPYAFTLTPHPCRAHPSLPLAPPPPAQIHAHPQLLVPHPVNASTPSPWSAWQNAARGEATLRVPTRQPTRRILVAISQPLFNKTGMLRWA